MLHEYLVLAVVEEAAVQAVVGSIVWAFRRLKKPRCREMSARGYALYSVCPQLSFFASITYKQVLRFGHDPLVCAPLSQSAWPGKTMVTHFSGRKI